MLRRICESKREDVTQDWRILHKDKLCNFYRPPNIILVIKSKMTCRQQKGKGYWVLVRTHEGKRMLGRPRCRWGNIKSFSRNGMGSMASS